MSALFQLRRQLNAIRDAIQRLAKLALEFVPGLDRRSLEKPAVAAQQLDQLTSPPGVDRRPFSGQGQCDAVGHTEGRYCRNVWICRDCAVMLSAERFAHLKSLHGQKIESVAP